MKGNVFVENECARLRDIDRRYSALSQCSRNLNLEVLTGKIGQVYNRESTIESVQKILLRRNKANVLLTGAAGCGKTAIAEGLAQRIVKDRLAYMKESGTETPKAVYTGDYQVSFTKKSTPKPLFFDCIIYELSMNSLLSGTKYRGEFEEKLQNVLRIISDNKNIVLFIDEIHQINEIGNSEGSTGMGHILKPALSRDELRVIGATTTEEAAIIKKDKALSRRFTEIVIPQLQGESAVECLGKVMDDYAAFHNIKIKGVDAKTLLEKVRYFMPNSVFPNNVIDVIDETLASAKYDNKKSVGMSEINQTMSRITGLIIC